MLSLRPYQSEALQRVWSAYKSGRRRVLVSLPTGTGKTVVFAHFPSFLKMQKRLLVLAHREELLVQAEEKFRSINPELRVEIEQAGSRASASSSVVIASVPTLARNDGNRLRNLNPDEFSIVVVDEAHHAVAESYKQIFNHFGLFAPETRRLLVGFTATPRRGDKRGLGEVFQEVCYAKDLREMIRDGYLCAIRGWRVNTDLSLDGVKVRHGDFVESQLARVVNTPSRNNLLLVAYLRLVGYRRALIFCVDVAHAQEVSRVFSESGIKAAAVWGDMPKDDRRQMLRKFSNGEISVLTNCNLLTEGFDEPRVNCVIMARPTKSKLLYAQMVGRGTRLHPEKSDLMIVDVVDNSKMHTLPGLHSLFNLPTNLDLRGLRVLDIEKEIERISRESPWIDTSRIHSPDDIRIAAERIEFFNFDPPPEVSDLTSNTWLGVNDGYRLNLPNSESLLIEPNLLDGWDVQLISGSRAPKLVVRSDTLSRAIAIADDFVARERPDAERVVQRFAEWRDELPTDKQKQLLARHGVPVPAGLTRGQAAQMISLIFAKTNR